MGLLRLRSWRWSASRPQGRFKIIVVVDVFVVVAVGIGGALEAGRWNRAAHVAKSSLLVVAALRFQWDRST